MHKFPADQWFVICEGNADIPLRNQALCERCQFFGRSLPCRERFVSHGNLVILAERAGEVAAEASGRQNIHSRMKLRQRFFADGIERKRRHLPVTGTYDPAADVRSGAAQTGLSRPAHGGGR